MIECGDPATCQQIAEQMKVIVINAVVLSVAVVVVVKMAMLHFTERDNE